MGFNRNYNTINNLNNLMDEHKRGVRNNDENGVLLNYHLPNLSDYQIHKSVADELNIAIRETQHRIDWINMIQARARQCLVR